MAINISEADTKALSLLNDMGHPDARLRCAVIGIEQIMIETFNPNGAVLFDREGNVLKSEIYTPGGFPPVWTDDIK